MSKKIVFKGTQDGCFLPFEPDLLQLDLQEPNTTEPPSDSRMKQIEELGKLSLKETKDFCFDSFSESERNLVITNAEIEEALTPPHYQPCNF